MPILIIMKRIIGRGIVIPTVFAAVFAAVLPLALAQNQNNQNMMLVPGAPGSMPLPPPPLINPQPPGTPPRIDSFSDKTKRCLHYGAMQGLTGGDLSAYSRGCANN